MVLPSVIPPRLARSRDRLLITRFGTEPTFVNATTQADFSTSYMITPQLNVYFSALNLNDATFSTHGRFSEQLLDVVDYGRRFTLGFRFKY